MKLALVFVSCLALAFGCSNSDPYGIKEKLYYTSCQSSDVIQPVSITVKDNAGNINYPINVAKPLIISAQSTDKSTLTYNTLKVDVTLQVFSNLFCRWITVPTFGLLNNLDGCSVGKNCPLVPGNLVLNVEVDLSKYASIISVLASDTPYLMDIHIKNGDDSQHEEIACYTVGAMIAKA